MRPGAHVHRRRERLHALHHGPARCGRADRNGQRVRERRRGCRARGPSLFQLRRPYERVVQTGERGGLLPTGRCLQRMGGQIQRRDLYEEPGERGRGPSYRRRGAAKARNEHRVAHDRHLLHTAAHHASGRGSIPGPGGARPAGRPCRERVHRQVFRRRRERTGQQLRHGVAFHHRRGEDTGCVHYRPKQAPDGPFGPEAGHLGVELQRGVASRVRRFVHQREPEHRPESAEFGLQRPFHLA